MNADQALVAISSASPQERLAVLDYFQCVAGPESLGYFVNWFAATLDHGRGDLAFVRLFTSVTDCGRKAELLSKLVLRVQEAAYCKLDLAAVSCRQWAAAQPQLSLELARSWSEQPPVSEPYWCSRHLVCILAQLFIPVIGESERSKLAHACLVNLLVHDLKPEHSSFPAFPDCAVKALSSDCLPEVLQLLSKGASQLTLEILKPYASKKSENPGNLSPFSWAFDALRILLAHPEWAGRLQAHRVECDRKVLLALIGLLWHTGLYTQWGEKPDAIVQRLEPLAALVAITSPDQRSADCDQDPVGRIRVGPRVGSVAGRWGGWGPLC